MVAHPSYTTLQRLVEIRQRKGAGKMKRTLVVVLVAALVFGQGGLVFAVDDSATLTLTVDDIRSLNAGADMAKTISAADNSTAGTDLYSGGISVSNTALWSGNRTGVSAYKITGVITDITAGTDLGITALASSFSGNTSAAAAAALTLAVAGAASASGDLITGVLAGAGSATVTYTITATHSGTRTGVKSITFKLTVVDS